MNNILYKTIKYIVLIIIFVLLTNQQFSYAKTIDINGIKANLNVEVTKKPEPVGSSVKEEKEKFSTTDYDKDNKEQEDKYVNVEVSIRNNNPYEAVEVNVVERVSGRFKQISTNTSGNKLSFKIDSNNEKVLKFKYKYEVNFILEQFNKLLYGKSEIDTVDNNSRYMETEVDTELDDIENKSKLDNDDSHTKNNSNAKILVIIFLIIIAGIVLFYLLRFIISELNDRNIDFDNYGKYYCIVFVIILSLILSFVNKARIYANNYEPIIYQKGQNFTKTITENIVFNEKYYSFSYEITVKYDNKHELKDYENDTDEDGLCDALEYLYMTNINDKDSDGDGLSDYIEVMILNYNPNSKWTFNDGRNDGFRDYDGDGLRNIKEIEYGTDLTIKDTDGDTLTDYEEINFVKSKDGRQTYDTDPLNIDTDEDGLNDDIEIKLGLNPTKSHTDGITLDSERRIEQEYSFDKLPHELRFGTFPITKIIGHTVGLIDDNLIIKNNVNHNFINSGLLIGEPMNIKLNNVYDYITITIDCSYYGERIKKLMFVKYVDNMIEPVTTRINGNEVSAEFATGEYGMIDVEQYLRRLNIYPEDYN